MTRAQVARYLRRSIATVRRAEGRHLHPHRDAKGIFRFDLEEVRALGAALDRGAVRLTRIDFVREHQARPGSRTPGDSDTGTAHVIIALEQELAELREVSRTLLHLFYSACPVNFISELDLELLETLETIVSPARCEEDT